MRRLLESYLGSSPQGAVAEIARERQALPVCTKPGLTMFLHPGGTVLTHIGDFGAEVDATDDPGWRWIAAIEAKELYPELRILIPDRPDNAPTCPACKGSGQLSFPAENPSRCGTCWGLGWLP